MTYFECKAATFNGNVVVGKGNTMESAFEAAQAEAQAIGSLIRKITSKRECVEAYAEGKRAYTFRFPV